MQQFYKVPDAQIRKLALGSLPGLPYRLRKGLQGIKDMFQPMDQPQPGQWLYEHEEDGQSFDAYKGQLHNKVDQKRNVIYIRPLEEISIQFLAELKRYCECYFYPMKIKIAKKQHSMEGVAVRINPYTNKPQFNAKSILQKLKKSLPSDGFCMIGVCMTDLYPRQQWNFVFGLASIKERTGVFSFARYDQRFFEMEKYEINYHLIKYRSMAVMGHEITHMFGIRHCIYYKCLMNGSNHLQQSIKKPMQLCVVCIRKLQSNINFDLLERYKMLRQLFANQNDQRVNKLMIFLNKAILNIEENTQK